MLDIKRIRENQEEVQAGLDKRGQYDLSSITVLEEKRRETLGQVEEMKSRQNVVSKQIPVLKKENKDCSDIFAEMKELANKIKDLDAEVKTIDDEIRIQLLNFPNIPNPQVKVGKDDTDNLEIRKWGEPRKFDFEIKAHWDIGVDLDILDFERAVKITGARFSMFKGEGARLQRALINFMLHTHCEEHHYTEISPPFMVNRESMTGTGQLPKFEEDAFHLPSKDFFLVPTAEVPVTNIYRDEILGEEELPKYFTAYTPCFRQEAGSAGRDTRGLIRNHQFDKVEMVQIVHPDKSYAALEEMTGHAEAVLQKRGLPSRVMSLCTSDMCFGAAKTYDLEVWVPAQDTYREISSVSNCEAFQARRMQARWRNPATGKPELVHTLNGSGVAVGRAMIAVMENYQNADGSITVPEALRPYMGGLEVIG